MVLNVIVFCLSTYKLKNVYWRSVKLYEVLPLTDTHDTQDELWELNKIPKYLFLLLYLNLNQEVWCII